MMLKTQFIRAVNYRTVGFRRTPGEEHRSSARHRICYVRLAWDSQNSRRVLCHLFALSLKSKFSTSPFLPGNPAARLPRLPGHNFAIFHKSP